MDAQSIVQEGSVTRFEKVARPGAWSNASPRLRSNPTWATQSIYNLLINALKFRRDGGRGMWKSTPTEREEIAFAYRNGDGSYNQKPVDMSVSTRSSDEHWTGTSYLHYANIYGGAALYSLHQSTVSTRPPLA